MKERDERPCRGLPREQNAVSWKDFGEATSKLFGLVQNFSTVVPSLANAFLFSRRSTIIMKYLASTTTVLLLLGCRRWRVAAAFSRSCRAFGGGGTIFRPTARRGRQAARIGLVLPTTRTAVHGASSSSSSSSPQQHAELYFDVSKIPCKTGNIPVPRRVGEYNLAYRLFRPMNLSSMRAAPVVALHGGPSLPSNYLWPLAKVVPYRSILFYDQLGCGASDEPTDVSLYSIDQAVDDLETVLRKLSVRRFHLYGQSFGGILAYEYLKRCAEQANNKQDDGMPQCLSVILSSAPPDIQKVEEDAEWLVEALERPELFRETHQCRTPELPPPLADAYAHAGSVWRGSSVLRDYVADTTVAECGGPAECSGDARGARFCTVDIALEANSQLEVGARKGNAGVQPPRTPRRPRELRRDD